MRPTALASLASLAFTLVLPGALASCAVREPGAAEGEGEGSVGGEGEGGVIVAGEGEGEGDGEGEGEGPPPHPGGEGEGEGAGGEGEGEGEGAVQPTCSSGHHWLLGELVHTDLMEPGMSCIQCHAQHGGAPHYQAAGTVMGALHDEDTCHGAAGVTVTLTGADGVTHTATTNSNGNFSFDGGIAMPYHASITVNGQTRSMISAQSDGDCMACHTVLGASAAPGRIVIPGVTPP